MKKYIMYCLLGMFPLLFSCSDDVRTGEEGHKTPVELSGLMTRADDTPRTNIYVKAYLNNTSTVYFDETLATIPDGLPTTGSNPIVFPGATPYYPFGEEEMQILAYSGKAPNGLMTLTAGTDINNDAVLSNYGKRNSDADDPDTYRALYEPGGTVGNSTDPVEILHFRHVMTQLTVGYNIDAASMVDQIPEYIEFTLDGNGVVTSGRYPVRAKESDAQAAQNLSSTKYKIKLGTNYLVPTGVDLVGAQMASLIIDDYTAKPEDLTDYKIVTREAGYTTMELRPGYAYRLTLTISRLRLTGITLTKTDWQPHIVTGKLTYDPYQLNLNLGDYDTVQNNDTISRVILVTKGEKQYIGKSMGGKIQFITLPTAATTADEVESVLLYTDKGLLINTVLQGSDTYTYNAAASTLAINLSAGGMKTENGGPVSPTNPYLITTTPQFMNIKQDLGSYYKLVETIDLNTLNLVSDSRLFNGLGDFTGSFDGNGYRIDGLDIEAAGLFNSNSGTLKNIRLSSGVIDATGKPYAGSIAGVNTGDIIACVNETQIVNANGATTKQGGIAGQNSGRIIACVNTGTIIQGITAGGIAGENLNTNPNTFVACINTGALNPNATNLGYLCGESVTTTNIVARACFGLVGSAQHVIGGPELAFGTGDNNTGNEDVAALEPSILRNGLIEGDAESTRIVNRLNQALADNYPVIAAAYKFIYNDPANPANPPEPITGITWPAPVMR